MGASSYKTAWHPGSMVATIRASDRDSNDDFDVVRKVMDLQVWEHMIERECCGGSAARTSARSWLSDWPT